MSADDIATVGKALPRLGSVSFHNGYEIAVTWDGATRNGRSDIVDLAPLLFRLKFYAPLRDDRELMSTVHTIDDGTAIAWGDDAIDMAATSVLNLAEETMSPADFVSFMKRHNFTFDRVAAELGISKRLAAYYASGRSVPRYIKLACDYIEKEKMREAFDNVIAKGISATEKTFPTLAKASASDYNLFLSTNMLSGSLRMNTVVKNIRNHLYAFTSGGTKVGLVEHMDELNKLVSQHHLVPIIWADPATMQDDFVETSAEADTSY